MPEWVEKTERELHCHDNMLDDWRNIVRNQSEIAPLSMQYTVEQETKGGEEITSKSQSCEACVTSKGISSRLLEATTTEAAAAASPTTTPTPQQLHSGIHGQPSLHQLAQHCDNNQLCRLRLLGKNNKKYI
ncbi:uncharacterized protein LOC126250429 [Schistocerca nitens]|uniref:uncharacterized protein LOC126250429 n=1 Tax=Schistocerca nitens TaxID=7011 RepID=UPI002117C847|nr:uncharacterized protein LOC126250429 [Schistocerca nitens]